MQIHRTINALAALVCSAACVDTASSADSSTPKADATVLWYRQPAEIWSEAVPLGNGRLGAMVFGTPAKERILLNEETVWTGGPYQPAAVDAAKHLPEIRRLVFEGQYGKAHKLFGRRMMGTPVEQMKYQPLGNLWLTRPDHEQVTDYRRDLNLDTAVATVRYSIGDVRFVREVLVSPVDQVVAVRLSASRPGQISLGAQLTGYRNEAHSNYGSEFYRIDGVEPDGLRLHGRTSTYLGVEGRVRFESQARFIVDGGTMHVDDDSLRVDRADTC
ncbi:MAG: glycoside hydrolase family 95 protein [Candidatus Nealsonbacteria bacterium]|nr:glycoside hydrolase family 95 protein [Candidatus Nealsonbacteria bacterium]